VKVSSLQHASSSFYYHYYYYYYYYYYYNNYRSSYTLHKTDKPGVLSLDILPSDQNLVVTGGADKEAVVFNRGSEKVRGWKWGWWWKRSERRGRGQWLMAFRIDR